MLTIEELEFLWNFLQGRTSVNAESMRIADKIYHLKQAAGQQERKRYRPSFDFLSFFNFLGTKFDII